jgi:hypothetical protein
MKAEWRLAWLYFTLFPIQRWLGLVALALSVIAVAAATFALLSGSNGVQANAASDLIPALLSFPMIFLLPGVLVSGAVFRALSAPHTHKLLPVFRRRVLGSIVLFMAVVCGFALIFLRFAVSLTPADERMPLSWGVLIAFGGVSAAIYFTFRMARVSRWLFLEVAGFAVLLQLLFGVDDRNAIPSMVLVWSLIAALLAGWVAFGFWYLRTPVIAAPDLSAGLAEARHWQQLEGKVGRDQAAMVLLTARAPVRLATALPAAIFVGVVLVAVLDWLLGADFRRDSMSGPLIPSMLMSIGIVNAMTVNTLGARARYLWLLGCPRSGVLALIERAAARQTLIGIALIATVLAIFVILNAELGLERAAAALLLGAGYIPLCSYAGLIRCRNFGFGEGAIVTVTGVVFVVLYTVTMRVSLSLGSVFLIAMAMIAAVLFVRAVVTHRFRDLNWLNYRVARPATGIANLLHNRRARAD